MNQLQVNLFGRLSVVWAGQVLTKFTTARVRDVLAFLVLYAGIEHRREDILKSIWEDSSADLDRNRLAVALYLLKKDLSRIGFDLGEILEVSRDTLRLRPEGISTDWQAFLTTTEQSRRTEGPTRELFAREAVQHYQGPLLPESDAIWVWPLRSEAEVAYRECILWLAQKAMDRQEPALAQDWLSRLQRLDPGSLAALAAVTEWHWMQGEVGEAQECAARLMRGYARAGINVSSATRDLVHRIWGPTAPHRWGTRVQTLCWMELDAEGRRHLAKEWASTGEDPIPVADPVAALEMAHTMVPGFADRAILATRAVVPGEDLPGAVGYDQVPAGAVYATRATVEVLKASGYAVVAERVGNLYRVTREG